MSIKLSIIQQLQHSRFFRWHVDFFTLNRKHMKSLLPYYDSATATAQGTRRVVCVMNGNFESGGLADRLRSIVSTYQVCKEQDITFHVLFTSPFSLADYLMPNTYDWQTTPADVHFSKEVGIICCEITDDTLYQARNLHQWLTAKILSSQSSEIHIYGNPNFSFHEGTYSQLFNELFTPSIRLQQSIDRHLQALGNNFIAIQLRFTSLLGDLTDYGVTLSPSRQQRLINSVIDKVGETITQHAKDSKVLVNSDSTKFLQALTKAMPEVYVIPGEIRHIDFTDNGPTDAYMKLFTEFFLMTHARHIYRITTSGMRKSGLPLSASLLSNVPLTDISF